MLPVKCGYIICFSKLDFTPVSQFFPKNSLNEVLFLVRFKDVIVWLEGGDGEGIFPRWNEWQPWENLHTGIRTSGVTMTSRWEQGVESILTLEYNLYLNPSFAMNICYLRGLGVWCSDMCSLKSLCYLMI